MKKIFLSLILFLFFTLNVKAVYVEGQERVEDDGQMHILSEVEEREEEKDLEESDELKEENDEVITYTGDINETFANTGVDDNILLYVGIGGGALVIFAIIGFISTKLEKKNKKEEKIETNNVQ